MIGCFALIFGTWLLAFGLAYTVRPSLNEFWFSVQLFLLLSLGCSGSIIALILTSH